MVGCIGFLLVINNGLIFSWWQIQGTGDWVTYPISFTKFCQVFGSHGAFSGGYEYLTYQEYNLTSLRQVYTFVHHYLIIGI